MPPGPNQQVPLEGFDQDVIQAEWADSGETLLFEAAEAVGRKSLWTVSREGGSPTRFHEFRSDQIHSGIGVSPDGRWAAYIDRDGDGFFQVFPGPARRWRSGTDHFGPHPQDPARVVTARRPDRVHRLQLPGPLLADPPVLARALRDRARGITVGPFSPRNIELLLHGRRPTPGVARQPIDKRHEHAAK